MLLADTLFLFLITLTSQVGDFVARERVTQCFRDALQDKYRSSNHSKKKRRKEQLQKAKVSQTPKLKKRKQNVNKKDLGSDMPSSFSTDVPGLFGAEVTLPQNMRVDNMPFPDSHNKDQPSVSTPASSVQFPTISNHQHSNGLPEAMPCLEQSHERPPFLSAFQDSLLKQFQPFGLSQQQLASFQAAHPDSTESLALPNLQREVNNDQPKNSPDSYPQNWFTTTNGNWAATINNVSASAGAAGRRFSLSSTLTGSAPQSPVGQPSLLFGNIASPAGSSFVNNAAALLPVLNGSASNSNSQYHHQQTASMMSSLLQQQLTSSSYAPNDSMPEMNYSFDLSLEPTPIAESISRRNLEGRSRNSFLK
jgi:hypothetical protein